MKRKFRQVAPLCVAAIMIALLLYFLKEAFPVPRVSPSHYKSLNNGFSSDEFNTVGAHMNKGEAEQEHNYRYVALRDPTVTGKSFNINGETSHIVSDYLRALYKRKPVTLDAKTPFFDIVASVTGASSNHFKELMKNVQFFPSRFPRQRLIFYDLGLTDSEVEVLKNMSYIEYRKFEFEKYPPHVKYLKYYAWKILIIGELLSEFDGVMWFDSSVVIYGNLTDVLERLVHFNSGILFFLKYAPVTHSIAAATDPGMIEYFPLTPKAKPGLVGDMMPGATILVFNTADVREHIMKWASICAIVKDCIVPPASKYDCPSNIWVIPRDQFAGCHRYEQACLSLLVTNLYDNERERYVMKRSEALADFFYWKG